MKEIKDAQKKELLCVESRVMHGLSSVCKQYSRDVISTLIAWKVRQALATYS